MNAALLDSFQYIVGIYILYVAVKGKGNMYQFRNVRAADAELVRRRLRLIYFVIALLCFLDGAATSLQNVLFQISFLEDGTKVITQIAALDWWPTVSYSFLFNAVNVLIALIVLLLGLAFLTVRRHSDS